jgi:mono/diheme cytochrome c family protein
MRRSTIFPVMCVIPLMGVVPLVGALALTIAATASEKPVTFSETIAPIVFENCAGCHRAGGAAPFTLVSYEDAVKHARKIAAVTRTRKMPPWHAESGSYPFKYDRRLTADQIALIQQWVQQGMPEGDRSKLPAVPDVPSGWQLGTPDAIVELPVGYDVPAHGPDVYRNFVIPLSLGEDRWLRAIEFRPSARTSVHHVLFFGDSSGAARQADAADSEPGFAGMGGRRWGNTPLGGWALGQQPHFLPDGVALPLPKGSDLVLQYHFHPHGKQETERPLIGLYFADRAPARTLTGLQLPVLFGFFAGIDIPAGARDFRVRDSFILPIDVEAVVIGAHAHFLGREMKMTATLPTGEQKTLLWIKRWDFAWQDRYYFKDLVPLPKGTRLDAEIAWDNSADNPDNPSDPPRRVTWGEQSTDEMGSIGLQVLPRRQEDLDTLKQAYRQHVRKSAGNSALGALRPRLP